MLMLIDFKAVLHVQFPGCRSSIMFSWAPICERAGWEYVGCQSLEDSWETKARQKAMKTQVIKDPKRHNRR